jgi:Ca2+-binding EF-hand superfamily protein
MVQSAHHFWVSNNYVRKYKNININIQTEYFLREEVTEFFEEMDRDFDGKLSFEEFMGEETPLERLFKSMDKDGDGTVSKEVMLASAVLIILTSREL